MCGVDVRGVDEFNFQCVFISYSVSVFKNVFVCYFIYSSLFISFLLETVILNLVILAMFTSYNCPPFGNAFVFLFRFFHKSDHFLFHYFLMSGSPLRACMFALCSSFPAAFTPLHPRFYVGSLGGNFPLLCSDFLRTVKSDPLLFLFFFFFFYPPCVIFVMLQETFPMTCV